MSSKRNDKAATSAPPTPGHSSQQQQQGFQTKSISRASADAQKPAQAWQQQQDAFQQREQERTFSMLWEKPTYPTSSSRSLPILKLDEHFKGPRLRRARSTGGTQPVTCPDNRRGKGRRTKDAEAFKGATPLEDWLKREGRYERFLGEGGRK